MGIGKHLIVLIGYTGMLKYVTDLRWQSAKFCDRLETVSSEVYHRFKHCVIWNLSQILTLLSQVCHRFWHCVISSLSQILALCYLKLESVIDLRWHSVKICDRLEMTVLKSVTDLRWHSVKICDRLEMTQC
jgi:hypothetical protein